MAPTTTKRWTIEGTDGFESLKLNEHAEIPKLGDNDILVKMHAASLNYRDLAMAKGMYPFPNRQGVVPTSDGAGEVEETGSNVSRFKKGDKVVTLFNQGHFGGSLTLPILFTGTGGMKDGALTQYGVFNEQAVVAMPESLSWLEASTLSCAAVTAWNALYGLEGRQLKPGDIVLTQGTGGVSIFALQFAVAAGATVIATTSSPAKAEKLKSLGAHHIINYRDDANWGETAKSLTPNGVGVTHIIEVGGASSMAQSLKAIRMDGLINVIGFLGGPGEEPGLSATLLNLCTVRGVLVGSRVLFEDMNRAIEANGIKPVVDEKVFGFEEVREAYQYMWDQKHFGKLTIEIAK